MKTTKLWQITNTMENVYLLKYVVCICMWKWYVYVCRGDMCMYVCSMYMWGGGMCMCVWMVRICVWFCVRVYTWGRKRPEVNSGCLPLLFHTIIVVIIIIIFWNNVLLLLKQCSLLKLASDCPRPCPHLSPLGSWMLTLTTSFNMVLGTRIRSSKHFTL